MPKYTPKPVVEALRFDKGNFAAIEKFVGGDSEFRDGKYLVATQFGPLLVTPGDYVVNLGYGKFYAMSAELFSAIYMEVK